MTRMSFRHGADRIAAAGGHRRVLWPGVLLPVVGLLGAAGLYIAVVVIVLHPGLRNETLGFRLGTEIPTVLAWLLYKAGSQRVVLDEDEMRIFTWGLCWRVPRGAVRDVELRLRDELSVAVILADGYRIRPTTFLVRRGIGHGNPNALYRASIRDKVLEWNATVPQAVPPAGHRRGGRYWRVRRDDLPVLAGAVIAVAIEAIVTTKLGVG